MKKVALFSALLMAGIVVSQVLPGLLGSAQAPVGHVLRLLTMIALAFIMIHVGFEFDLDKSRLRDFGWDYIVAMTAAALPWILVCLYFVFAMLPEGSAGSWPAWKESLLASRFAAPTSAGVLFSMLAAAGLGGTWLFGKARVLAIFDDLDTVLLMVPLQMLMVGLAWQLGVIVVFMAVLLWLAWRYLHAWQIPISWPWVLGYAAAIGLTSELMYFASKIVDETIPVHVEVLLPAFVLGCLIARPKVCEPHAEGAGHRQHHGLEDPAEQRVATVISAVFMVLVGLSMPPVLAGTPAEIAVDTVSAAQPMPGWATLGVHVVLLTLLANLGKMYPALCYRQDASLRERVALAIGLWPRGEVGAGVLVISLSYGIGGPILTTAMLCLTLNLVLTGAFILMVRKLVAT